jgi:ABC-type antimicrobial peptide transport system permease subunit
LDVFATVVAEGAVIGLFGGVVGSSLGVVGAIGVAASLGWNPIVLPSAPIIGTASAVAIGILAGLLPGVRAIHIEPVDALRSVG